jgi:NAD(P)-dependent dehydrogenase (short-subunit alcohol dehydrogenase family)
MQVNGTAAIVTGAASGMGLTTARMLAQAGAKVAMLDMNADALAAAAAELGGLAVVCDVTSAESAERAVEEATQAHGAARVCINCAGIGNAGRIVGRSGPLALEDFARVINVNLIGTFNVLRLAAAKMIALEPANETGERGVIVNTASVAAYEGQIGQSAYAASKGGVVSLTLVAAREFASQGVRVNTVAPGLIRTPMLAGLPEEVQDSLGATVPFPRRLGEPEEFSSLVMHIIDNAMINGETIRLDGALRMQPR